MLCTVSVGFSNHCLSARQSTVVGCCVEWEECDVSADCAVGYEYRQYVSGMSQVDVLNCRLVGIDNKDLGSRPSPARAK